MHNEVRKGIFWLLAKGNDVFVLPKTGTKRKEYLKDECASRAHTSLTAIAEQRLQYTTEAVSGSDVFVNSIRGSASGCF